MSEPSPAKPTMYCRKCWYVLDGLTEHRCPECGRVFDSAKRRTYRTKPRGYLRRWCVRTLAWLAPVLLVVVGAGTAWLYWLHAVEAKVADELKALGFTRVQMSPYGPEWAIRWAMRLNLPVPETVNLVHYRNPSPGAVGLGLPKAPLGDDALRPLERLRDLRALILWNTHVGDQGLSHIKHLHSLGALFLPGAEVTDAGLVHLRGCTNLRLLDLSYTKVTDAGLKHLKGLPNLERLHILGTPVTDAGVADLRRALAGLKVWGRGKLN